MTAAPILRSAALRNALALIPVRSPASATGTSFAATLAKSQTDKNSVRKPVALTPRTVAPFTGALAPKSVLPAAPQETLSGPIPFHDEIVAAANKYGIDPALLAGLVKQESGFNPNAQSGVGAKGLAQLMDATARGLGVSNPFDPVQSLDGAANFLSGLLKQFHGDQSLALAAYNAGPGAVQKYGGIPPYQETQRYVPKVLGYAAQFRRIMATS
jgi:soluble lytic murein transglycosylase-like protein